MAKILAEMESLKKKIAGLSGGSGVDDAALNEMKLRMDHLQNELNSLKDEFLKWIKDFQDQLNNKADLSQLAELERQIMERLDNLVKSLIKQLADKNETKKALKLLERQLKNFYDLYVSRGNGAPTEDEAMFTKKQLLPGACASCEKNLVNLQGKQANYLPWQQFPYRDPTERIAKVGQGFSKMLSMINPDALSRYEASHNHGMSTKVSLEHNGEPSLKDNRIHTIHHKTQHNFFNPSPGKLQDMSRRPGSAQVLPRPKRVATSKKRKLA